MTIAAAGSDLSVPWWKEPTRDQWLAWIAAWLGWMLDAFDFTIFLLLMTAIAEEFQVSVTAVASVLTFTLWLRLIGAVGAGWLGDRVGRKIPLIVSIVWFSACNFLAGFSPSFMFLFAVRAILGIGMGAEWPAGASLAMESWPARSRGLMGGLLQGTWGLGFALSGLAYWLLLDSIGWRGLLWLAALPAPIVCAYIHYCVKEPPVWVENRKRQREVKAEVRAPLLYIFKPALLGNTSTACWWVASVMIVYYSVNGLFATWLQTELKVVAGIITAAIVSANLAVLIAEAFWGRLADGIGRRGAIMIQAAIACLVAPAYLLTDDLTWIVIGFVIQGAFAGSLPALTPAYLTERFPTELRCTASAFCYHVGIVVGGLVPPAISYFAVERHTGFAVPMLIGTVAGSVSVILSLLVSPETKGKVFVAELTTH